MVNYCQSTVNILCRVQYHKLRNLNSKCTNFSITSQNLLGNVSCQHGGVSGLCSTSCKPLRMLSPPSFCSLLLALFFTVYLPERYLGVVAESDFTEDLLFVVLSWIDWSKGKLNDLPEVGSLGIRTKNPLAPSHLL